MTIRFFRSRPLPRENDILRFARRVCRAVPALRLPGEVCVLFVSDRKIRAVNRRFLNHDYNTDVIAFPYAPPRRAGGPFGDLYVSLDTAARQARQGGHALAQEAALLVAHGLLHLAGYDDRTPAKKKRMFAKQSALFRAVDLSLAPPDFR